MAAFLLAVLEVGASGDPAEGWLSGESLRRRLVEPAGLTAADAPFRATLCGFANRQRVALLLDRRVDPSRETEFDFAVLPLETALDQLAIAGEQGWTVLDNVVYFGPLSAASRLRTLSAVRAEEVQRAGASAIEVFRARRALRWDDFAAPRAILSDLASSAGLSVQGAERIPHDLWAGCDLPSLSLVDRLTLILVQFDLTFKLVEGGGGIELTPIPSDLGLVRRYPAGSETAAWIARWSAQLPECRFKADGAAVWVKGLLEDHERIRGNAKPKPAASPAASQAASPSDRLDTLRIERFTVEDAPLSEVLAKLGKGLGLTWSIDQEQLRLAGISLEQRVSFQVENGTVDELLDAMFHPAGLAYRRRGNTVEIRPK